jgi:hypothetical protein
MRKAIVLFILLLITIFSTALAQIPQKISYQGVLYDNEGNALTGIHTIVCKIYDVQFFGNPIWEETHEVTCENGAFDVLLGTDVSLDNLAFDVPYYLEITVGESTPLPRVLISSAAYAMSSKISLDNQWTITENGDIHNKNNGYVGIGTDAPITPLMVEGDLTVTGDVWAVNAVHANLIDAFGGSISSMDIFVDGNITAVGNIGIGTDLPEERLDVRGGIRIGNSENIAEGTIRWNGVDFEGSTGSEWLSLTQDKLFTKNGDNIYTTNSGFVGIGTDNPADKLHVAGNIIADGSIVCFGEMATTNLLADGNAVVMGMVGINNSSPTSSLQIDGSKAWAVTETSSSMALDETHNVVLCNNGSTITISLPPAGSCPGRVYTIKRISVAPIIIDPYESETIDAMTTYTLTQNLMRITIISNGINWYIISN